MSDENKLTAGPVKSVFISNIPKSDLEILQEQIAELRLMVEAHAKAIKALQEVNDRQIEWSGISHNRSLSDNPQSGKYEHKYPEDR